MNYDQPELLEQLAAAYAVGTLRGRARQRFTRWCLHSAAARVTLRRWEDRLAPLALHDRPLAPGAAVWRAIEQRLDAELREPRSGNRRWRAALAAGLLVALLLVGQTTLWAPEQWHTVATLAPANAAPQWRIERNTAGTRLTIRTVGVVSASPASAYELWALQGGGAAPVSLGVLPSNGDLVLELSAAQSASLMAAMNVAVSVEVAGGSPTGLPQGPVIMVAPVAAQG